MLHKITPQTEPLVRELGILALEIDGSLLSAASKSARQEWHEFRDRWPSPDQLREGAVALSDDELAVMLTQVQRFKAILASRSDAHPG